MIVARNERGEAVTWPVAENVHRDGILDVSIVPARVSRRSDRARPRHGDAHRHGSRLPRRAVRRDVRRRRRRAARQRSRAAAAQQRALRDRRLRDVAIRAAGARAGGPAARRDPPAHAGRDGEPAGRHLVRRHRPRSPREPAWRDVLAEPQAKLHLYGKIGGPPRPQDGPRHLPRRPRSTTRWPPRAGSSAHWAFPAPTTSDRDPRSPFQERLRALPASRAAPMGSVAARANSGSVQRQPAAA